MSNLTFNVVDVETANADRSSICQIGVAHVRDGNIVDKWGTYINPEDWFDPHNVGIHGINEKKVADAPTIPKVMDGLRKRLAGEILVAHSSFDRGAFGRATEKYSLEQLQVNWLDSTQIVRRTWPDKYAQRGYGLKNLASDFGITYKPHDAVEDATTTAKITLLAMEHSDLDVDGWLDRVKRPIFNRPGAGKRENLEGDPNGPLYGEVCVLTGNLTVKQSELGKQAQSFGCAVKQGVTVHTTLVVVGTQNPNVMAKGYDKSSKHRKAEKLVKEGQEIKILSEDDFRNFLNQAQQ